MYRFSIALCKFTSQGDQQYVIVGTGKELILNPRSHQGGAIHCYKLANSRLELVHKTPLDDIPGAICPFQGRVLISVGKLLRIYDLGKKKMLRKCENKVRDFLFSRTPLVGHVMFFADSCVLV